MKIEDGNHFSASNGRQSQPGASSRRTSVPGDVLDALGNRYSDLLYVDSGATSDIFSAHDCVLDKAVAIKILKEPSKKRLIAFQKEAKAAAKLSHPNLVHVLNFGITKNNHAYLITEFVDGDSLEQLLCKNGPLSPIEALSMMVQLCDGMTHAHNKGLAHRDLKTSNIIVNRIEPSSTAQGSESGKFDGLGTNGWRKGRPVIVDFGLAHETQNTEATHAGKFYGSPLFMSPEQASGRRGNERSDIYSMGCILFNMLTGKTLFTGSDIFEILGKHREQPHPRLIDVTPDLVHPPDLQYCLDKMLAKDPASRWQSMAELGQALDEILEDLRRHSVLQETNPSEIGPAKSSGSEARDSTSTIVSIISALQKAWSSPRRMALYFLTAGALVLPAVASYLYLSRSSDAVSDCQSGDTADPVQSLAESARLNEETNKKFSELFAFQRSGDFLDDTTLDYIHPVWPERLKDTDLGCLSGWQLTSSNMSLAGTPISGQGLKHLLNAHLEGLDLSRTHLSPAGFEQLVQLKYLKRLSFDDSSITDEDVKKLIALPHLAQLHLNSCHKLTDRCIDSIVQMPALIRLDLNEDKFTAEAIGELYKNKTLESISLIRTRANDKTLSKLSRLKLLSYLQLNCCTEVTGRGLNDIAEGLPHMEYLAIEGTKVTQKDLPAIGRFENLGTLNVSGLPISDDDVPNLCRLKHLRRLYIGGAKITDAGLTRLMSNLPELAYLQLINCPNITTTKVAELRASYKQCSICNQGAGAPPVIKETLQLFIDQDTDPSKLQKVSPEIN